MPNTQHNEQVQAFRRIYEQLWSPLCYFARQYVHGQDAAEDLVTDSFLKVWPLMERFNSPERIRSFLYISLRNACISHQRSAKRTHLREVGWHYVTGQQEDGNVHCTEAEAIRQAALERLFQEISKLPRKRLTVFRMAFIEGIKNEQIADMLNLSRQTVKNQKLLAVRALQTALQGLTKQVQWALC